jgi:hypothetical protein
MDIAFGTTVNDADPPAEYLWIYSSAERDKKKIDFKGGETK